MSSKKVIFTENAAKPVGPYSQAVQVGDLLFISGQLPVDIESGEIIRGDVKRATELILKSIKAILEQADYSLNHVVRCTVFLKDMDTFSDMNEVYAKFFTEKPPARAAVEVARLPKDVDVEISAIAIKN